MASQLSKVDLGSFSLSISRKKHFIENDYGKNTREKSFKLPTIKIKIDKIWFACSDTIAKNTFSFELIKLAKFPTSHDLFQQIKARNHYNSNGL